MSFDNLKEPKMDETLDKSILLGWWRAMLPIPSSVWKKQIQGDPNKLDFMSEEHHRVRNFVVVELPHIAKPLTPEYISQNLGLSQNRVIQLLDELERNMTFLFRDVDGAVTWAYPVTVDETPHRVTFSSGEQIYAA
jgi:hypothetical protein